MKINLPKETLLLILFTIGTFLQAQETEQLLENFNKKKEEKSAFSGRLRNNNFYYRYETPDTKKKDHLLSAFGLSLLYQSKIKNHISFTLELHASKAFFDENSIDVSQLRSAKDTLSRLKYSNTGSTSLYALSQANLSYFYKKTELKLGRQIIKTFYTRGNNSKMIPNTFDALLISSKDFKKMHLTFAYLAKQKLRDHEESHSLFMYGDANSSRLKNPQWTQNDDSAMHTGLTYTALKAANKPTQAPVIIMEIKKQYITQTKIRFSSYIVPELLAQAMGEIDYKLPLNSWDITTGIRYVQQFDHGAGSVGGASLKGNVNSSNPLSYKNPNSLNAKMIAARIILKAEDYRVNLAYSNILDEADLVTPWRGFPTAGYTRSMGIYNWKANTKSYRLEILKGANKKAFYIFPLLQTSVLYINGDQSKYETDSLYYYFGITQNIFSMKNVQYKLRLGYRDFMAASSNVSDALDSRLEFNYLF